jgi:transposase
MRRTDHHSIRPKTAVRDHDSWLFVALELSRSSWLIAVNAPSSDRISRYQIAAGDTAGFLDLLRRLKVRAERDCGKAVKIVSIHEAGLDGFWVHRFLEANGVESHVVDAASIAVNRRSRKFGSPFNDSSVNHGC